MFLPERLKPAIAKLFALREWLMEFNPDKCFVLNITRKRKPSKNTYTLKNQTLQTVKTTTYLGVEISDDLSWSPHINKITKQDCPRKITQLTETSLTKNEQRKDAKEVEEGI